jgi:hypothetical protein
MASYIGALPNMPTARNWAPSHVTWGMMANDRLGDCTCAAAGHAIQTWTGDNGAVVTLSDSDIVGAYSAITGYTPNNPESDRGAIELDVLKYWRTTGVGGHRIGAFVALEPKNQAHVKAAINLFGGSYIGLALPLTAQTQKIWAVTAQYPKGPAYPGSWGGHAVYVLAYDPNGLTCVTWGGIQRMTWRFWNDYCDEAYAILSSDWVRPGKRAPSGLDLPALQADLALVTH